MKVQFAGWRSSLFGPNIPIIGPLWMLITVVPLGP